MMAPRNVQPRKDSINRSGFIVWSTLLAFSCLFIVGGASFAQEVAPVQPPPPVQQTVDPLNPPQQNAEELPPLKYSGPLANAGQQLHDAGLDLGLTYVNIYQNAVSTGFKPGSYIDVGLLIADAKIHLSNLFQINFAETFYVPNINGDTYTLAVSNPFYPLPIIAAQSNLTRMTGEAHLLDGRLDLEGGRMGLNSDFMKKGFCGGIGCIPSTPAVTLGIPGDPLSVWGGRASYNLAPGRKVSFGVIEDNPGAWQNGDGWNWRLGHSQGYIAVINLTQDESFLQTRNPLTYEIGAYRRSATYADALYNTGWGNPTLLTPNPKIINHNEGDNGIYAQARKVLWSTPGAGPAGPVLPKNIAAYGAFFSTFGDGVSYPLEAYAGLEYAGFIPENPLALIGLTVHYINLSNKQAYYERNARLFYTALSTGSAVDQLQPMSTFQFDLHGRVGVPNGILDIGAAYMVNPDSGILADYSTTRAKNGFVIYATLAFDLSGALGLSPGKGP